MSPFLSTLGGGSFQGFQAMSGGGGIGSDASDPAPNVKALDGQSNDYYYVRLNDNSVQYGRCESLGSTAGQMFMRVLHQHHTSLFASQSETRSKNSGDPRTYANRGESWTYSIMGGADRMFDSGGVAEWYAKWEGISGYNQWRQTSNPLSGTSSVSGYQSINIDSSYGTWGGISGSDDQSATEWDGHIGGSWWYSWGNYRNHSPYFPVAGNDKQWCDLWCRW